MGGAKLCKPTVWSTFLASLVSTASVFVGLLVLGSSQLGIQNFQKEIWSTLALRCIGWSFLFYIPINVASLPPLGIISKHADFNVLKKIEVMDLWDMIMIDVDMGLGLGGCCLFCFELV